MTEIVGVTVAPKQMSGILFIATVGGFFTITVCGVKVVTAPQELVVVNVIE